MEEAISDGLLHSSSLPVVRHLLSLTPLLNSLPTASVQRLLLSFLHQHTAQLRSSKESITRLSTALLGCAFSFISSTLLPLQPSLLPSFLPFYLHHSLIQRDTVQLNLDVRALMAAMQHSTPLFANLSPPPPLSSQSMSTSASTFTSSTASALSALEDDNQRWVEQLAANAWRDRSDGQLMALLRVFEGRVEGAGDAGAGSADGEGRAWPVGLWCSGLILSLAFELRKEDHSDRQPQPHLPLPLPLLRTFFDALARHFTRLHQPPTATLAASTSLLPPPAFTSASTSSFFLSLSASAVPSFLRYLLDRLLLCLADVTATTAAAPPPALLSSPRAGLVRDVLVFLLSSPSLSSLQAQVAHLLALHIRSPTQTWTLLLPLLLPSSASASASASGSGSGSGFHSLTCSVRAVHLLAAILEQGALDRAECPSSQLLCWRSLCSYPASSQPQPATAPRSDAQPSQLSPHGTSAPQRHTTTPHSSSRVRMSRRRGRRPACRSGTPTHPVYPTAAHRPRPRQRRLVPHLCLPPGSAHPRPASPLPLLYVALCISLCVVEAAWSDAWSVLVPCVLRRGDECVSDAAALSALLSSLSSSPSGSAVCAALMAAAASMRLQPHLRLRLLSLLQPVPCAAVFEPACALLSQLLTCAADAPLSEEDAASLALLMPRVEAKSIASSGGDAADAAVSLLLRALSSRPPFALLSIARVQPQLFRVLSSSQQSALLSALMRTLLAPSTDAELHEAVSHCLASLPLSASHLLPYLSCERGDVELSAALDVLSATVESVEGGSQLLTPLFALLRALLQRGEWGQRGEELKQATLTLLTRLTRSLHSSGAASAPLAPLLDVDAILTCLTLQPQTSPLSSSSSSSSLLTSSAPTVSSAAVHSRVLALTLLCSVAPLLPPSAAAALLVPLFTHLASLPLTGSSAGAFTLALMESAMSSVLPALLPAPTSASAVSPQGVVDRFHSRPLGFADSVLSSAVSAAAAVPGEGPLHPLAARRPLPAPPQSSAPAEDAAQTAGEEGQAPRGEGRRRRKANQSLTSAAASGAADEALRQREGEGGGGAR